MEVLGRKGTLAQFSKEMGQALAGGARARVGKRSMPPSRARSGAGSRKQPFDDAALARRLDAEWVDLTLPAPGVRPGSAHPITQIQQEIEEVFISMGFAVLDGPEVETEYNNFDALNIPRRSSRARHAGYVLAGRTAHLLRTHTSPVQVRGMEKLGPPLRMIAPGRVFRNEEVDPSHEHTFYQLEGMMVDREVSVAQHALLHEDAADGDLPS